MLSQQLLLTIFLPLAGALALWLAAPAGRSVGRVIALVVTVVTLFCAGQLVLGYAAATFVRSIAEVAQIAAYQPFEDNNLHYVGFLGRPPDEETAKKLHSSATELDVFHLRGRELYWLCRRFSDSKFSGPLLEKTLGMRTTLRNSNTIKRIAAKYA